jgi:hypothetical protein
MTRAAREKLGCWMLLSAFAAGIILFAAAFGSAFGGWIGAMIAGALAAYVCVAVALVHS